jgi:hypothetical protein
MSETNIRKKWVDVGGNLKKLRFTQNTVIDLDSNRKGRIREKVETTITEGSTYDNNDLIADMANALNALLTACNTAGVDISDPAIIKYGERQAAIQAIIDDN